MADFLRYQAQTQRLEEEDVKNINEAMRNGWLCVLPSDSSYILTGRLTVPVVSENIDTLLDRQGMEMSLAFGNLDQVCKMMNLSDLACEFLKQLTPGGLTFVARPSNRKLSSFSENQLHADGTIGIRLTESQIETQLAENFPLPSTPIRDAENKEVFSADKAFQIISERMAAKGLYQNIILIEGEVLHPGRLSTVVKEEKNDGLWQLRIIREKAISIDRIREVADLCGYAGVINTNQGLKKSTAEATAMRPMI